MKTMKYLMAIAITAAAATGLASCGSSKEKEQTAAENAAVEETVAAQPAVTVLEKGATIGKETDKLVVIDFNATWCGPCRQFAPTFDKVAEEYQGKARFYSVDVDVHPELAGQYQVQSIPMVAYIKPDGTYTTTVGLLSESDFKAALDAAL